MTSISNTLGFAATALLSLGYAVRVAFEHDRRADDERYGVAPRRSAVMPTSPALPVRQRVPAARAEERVAALV